VPIVTRYAQLRTEFEAEQAASRQANTKAQSSGDKRTGTEKRRRDLVVEYSRRMVDLADVWFRIRWFRPERGAWANSAAGFSNRLRAGSRPAGGGYRRFDSMETTESRAETGRSNRRASWAIKLLPGFPSPLPSKSTPAALLIPEPITSTSIRRVRANG
jgi:hypothetical protein